LPAGNTQEFARVAIDESVPSVSLNLLPSLDWKICSESQRGKDRETSEFAEALEGSGIQITWRFRRCHRIISSILESAVATSAGPRKQN
jgi:hypothetical protein